MNDHTRNLLLDAEEMICRSNSAPGRSDSDEWRPIATAPMDGSPFLTYSPPIHEDDDPRDCYDIAYWDEGFGSFAKMGCGFDSVTHWMPIHAPQA